MSEQVRQTKVDWHGGYMRRFWSLKNVSLTVKCKSTEGRKAGLCTNNFRNHFRRWLYQVPGSFQDELDIMNDEDQDDLADQGVNCLIDIQHTIEVLKLDDQVSIQIKSYEKDFFYMKCLQLELKPPIMLRVLLRLSRREKLEEIFTSPEELFSMIYLTEKKPILRKDVKWVIV